MSAPQRSRHLLLRQWRDDDRGASAAVDADHEVVAHFPAPLTREASDALVDSTPAVGVGWRFARWAWGHGWASEAASRALDVDVDVDVAFDDLGLDEVVSSTATTDLRSQAVMRRTGLHRDPRGDVDHPWVPVSAPLRRHVLHRVAAADRAR